jgi:uncharacterized alpha-E superfamily protein
MVSFYRYDKQSTKESQEILLKALTHLTMTYPGFLGVDEEKPKKAMDEILSVIKDENRVGTVAYTFSMLLNASLNLKDILAMDSWKLHNQMKNEWSEFSKNKSTSNIFIVSKLENILISLMAYKEMVEESIYKEQGLRLYEIGYKMEDAMLLISMCRSLLTLQVDKSIEYDLLDSILQAKQSFNAYRANYKTSLVLKNIIEFLIFNKKFPKSIIATSKSLLKKFNTLPKATETMSAYEEEIYKAYDLLETLEIEHLLKLEEDETVYFTFDEILATLMQHYLDASNEFTKTYFSHNDE